MPAPNNTNYLHDAYADADRKARVRYLKVGCLLLALLTLSGVGLDSVAYPNDRWRLFEIRLACAVIALGIFGLTWLRGIERFIKPVGIVWALVAQASICAMIYAEDGWRSPYYAGLNLTTLGISILLPWTFWETVAVCMAALGMYFAAIFSKGAIDFSAKEFACSVSFLIFTDTICATCCYFAAKRRFSDFQLRHELDCRNGELMELDRLKMEFFSNISHELRTPLTLIVSPLDDMLNDLSGAGISGRSRETLAMVRQNSLRLLKMINELLELERLEDARKEIKKEALDLSTRLPGLVDSVRHLAMNKGLKIYSDSAAGELIVDADAGRLEKVVLNVLMNAIKFTLSGGEIRVNWKNENGMALIEISDTGIGIAEKDLPAVFERFRQVDSSATRRRQGSGIGLALARELVLELGGKLEVRSKLNEGSTFSIWLPLSAAALPAPVAPAAVQSAKDEEKEDPIADIHRRSNLVLVSDAVSEAPGVSGQGETTVLVVDDEPDMRKFVVGVLAGEYRVVHVANGHAGLEAAKKYKPILAVLDLMLPGLNGLELCSAFRADAELKNIRVVLLTARSDESAKIDALQRGADDFMTKPFSTLELRTRVGKLVSSAKLEMEVHRKNTELTEAMKQLRDAEAQLVQSEKMNALGGLAAGLLHEINNPLNYTIMALQMARAGVPKDSADVCDALNDIDEGMVRIRDIIHELRTYASPAASDAIEDFDLMTVSNMALRLVSRELEGIRVERDLPSRVAASKTLVIQVLVNLIMNSAKAMRPAAKRDKLIKISSRPKGQRINVSVWDNGAGIPADVLPHIFEPFFTTRPMGQGTGLGLSVCHTIVRKFRGEISVRSEPGNWTEFSFDLPATQSEVH